MRIIPPFIDSTAYTLINGVCGISASVLAALTGEQETISWGLAAVIGLLTIHNLAHTAVKKYLKPKNKKEEE